MVYRFYKLTTSPFGLLQSWLSSRPCINVRNSLWRELISNNTNIVSTKIYFIMLLHYWRRYKYYKKQLIQLVLSNKYRLENKIKRL